jgi:hypothetical protein
MSAGAVAALGLAARQRFDFTTAAGPDHSRARQQLLEIRTLTLRARCSAIGGDECFEMPPTSAARVFE